MASLAFSVSWQKPGEGSGGSTYDLRDWDGLATAITGLAWREDGKLILRCETADGGTNRLIFDPERGMFRGQLQAVCRGWLVAATQESGEIVGFTVKGEVVL